MANPWRFTSKPSVFKRVISPAGVPLITFALSWVVYENAWRIDILWLRQVLSFLSGIVMFVSIGFGTLLVYPIAFSRNAGPAERVAACLITPILWDLKEIIRVTEFFTLGESIYYGFNPVFLGLVAATLFQMGFMEALCRWRTRWGGSNIRSVVWPAPAVTMFLGLSGVFLFLAWGVGVHWFYIYQEGYKALFT